MDQAPESRFGLRFSACGVLDLCHVRNVKKLDQVNCAKLTYIQSNRVDTDRWKKILVEIFGGNVIFDIIEPPALKKYSIQSGLCL